jgi:sulfoxide reductase catalytic subunit YedY
MLIKKPAAIALSEITPKALYVNRRTFLQGASAMVGAAALGGMAACHAGSSASRVAFADTSGAGTKIEGTQKSSLSTAGEKLTPFRDITNYNNYYEFSTDKYEPAGLAKDFKTRPWTIEVEGLVKNPKVYDVDSLIKLSAPEERIYRHRCVEGWSMVMPWVGFSLSVLIKKVEPLAKARYVEFTTLYDPKQMPGQRVGILDWPYVEGLRMDEATHPLAILCFGLYGEALPNQDGAPLRIVVPWKYGFKSAKAIVKIRFVEEQPISTWTRFAPNAYGFYSNVNPEVDNILWSQATERRIGEFFKRPTLKFNGYEDQVSALYTGMDLQKNF